MLSIDQFQFFDSEVEVSITAGDLPHWQQAGATYFITYRTLDSISSIAMDRIRAERNNWLQRNGINTALPGWHFLLRKLSDAQKRTFHRNFSASFERELDRLEGECLLRKPALARHVAESLRYFDSERYQMGAFVVMPNHVHVLVRVFREYNMLQQCYGWKHFQAHRINWPRIGADTFFSPKVLIT